MGDMAEVFNAMKQRNKRRRAKNLQKADSAGWEVHTEYHWSRLLNGKKLDYWPSRNKFMYNGKVMTGDVMGYIRKREKQNENT